MQGIKVNDCTFYSKVEFMDMKLSSEIYMTLVKRAPAEEEKEFKSSNSYVSYSNEDNKTEFGRIFCFSKCDSNTRVECLIRKLEIKQDTF